MRCVHQVLNYDWRRRASNISPFEKDVCYHWGGGPCTSDVPATADATRRVWRAGSKRMHTAYSLLRYRVSLQHLRQKQDTAVHTEFHLHYEPVMVRGAGNGSSIPETWTVGPTARSTQTSLQFPFNLLSLKFK